jgi:hypothetical protein
MHRTIEITSPPPRTDELVEKLGRLDGVINLSVVRGASVKPEGDVVTVHALNRGADEVLRLAEAASVLGGVSVSTGELSSLVDPVHQREVAEDVDEALWEEVETGLRHQSRTTANYLILMALGGAIAATGFVVHSTEQALSFVAAAIVAPGFDALAKTSVGLALRRRGAAARGLGSAALGYLVLALSAALVLVVLRLTGVATVGEFAHNHEVKALAHPALRGVLLSACWYSTGLFAVPVRWVLIRDPEGGFKTQALLCTDLDADPEEILRWFMMRWQLEVTFQEMRRHLGFETQRQWSELAMRRTTPALLGLFSIVTLFAHQRMRRSMQAIRKAAWYRKSRPTFADALALVRKELWTQEERTFYGLPSATETVKVPRAFVERLTDAVCYAA